MTRQKNMDNTEMNTQWDRLLFSMLLHAAVDGCASLVTLEHRMIQNRTWQIQNANHR